jgi:glycine cleavage system aminomethyltransferase T
MTNSWRFSTLGDRHRALGSNLEDWSGMGTAWSYSKGDPDAEYMAIRTKAGLMDVSGLKKVHITGHAASHVIDRATTRDPEKLMPGRVGLCLHAERRGQVRGRLHHLPDGAEQLTPWCTARVRGMSS